MAKKNNKVNRERKIGKQSVEKKPLIKPEHKNTFWTVVVLIVLFIFFIVNNTRKEPEHGPYPPNFKPIQNEKNFNN